MKVKQSEINKLVRKIAKANTALQDAYGLMDEVTSNNLAYEIIHGNEDCAEVLKAMAVTFKQLDKKDEELFDLEMRGSNAQEWDSLIGKINDTLHVD